MRASSALFSALIASATAQSVNQANDGLDVPAKAVADDIRQAYCLRIPCVCGSCASNQDKPVLIPGHPPVTPSTVVTTVTQTHVETSTTTSLEVSVSLTTFATTITSEDRSTKTHVLHPEATYTLKHTESWLVWPEIQIRAPTQADCYRTRARCPKNCATHAVTPLPAVSPVVTQAQVTSPVAITVCSTPSASASADVVTTTVFETTVVVEESIKGEAHSCVRETSSAPTTLSGVVDATSTDATTSDLNTEEASDSCSTGTED